MLPIEKQIKRLQRIKAQIDLLQQIVSNFKTEVKEKSKEHQALETEHPGLLEEVCSKCISFCTTEIEQLSQGDIESSKPTNKSIIAKKEEITTDKPKIDSVIQDMQSEEPTDPLRFLMKYKSFDGKRVTYSSKDGIVEGKVVGLLTPFIKIQLDTGYVINAEPSKTKIIMA